jgi:outer membrane protein
MPEPKTQPSRWGKTRCEVLTVAGLALVALAGTASAGWNTPPVPAGPARTVELPTPPPPPSTTVPTIPEDLLKPGATVTLARIVDIALQNNPLTRASYLQALSAAAQLGSKRAPYYPSVDLSASATRTNLLTSDPSLSGNFDVYGPGVTLTYLLLDMGGRSANVADARYSLIAADWSHNATIQNVILGVETTYVQYLDAKAQLEAARASAKEAQTALDAANVRHDAGVATIAEVLQAKTAFSQAELALQTFDGQVFALRGSLATAMGLPANTPYDVGTLPAEIPLEQGTDAVEELIATARTQRPDLAAARALVGKADAHIRAVRSDGLPSLSLSATADRTYYNPGVTVSPVNAWSASALLTFPLFTGFANTYNLKQAKEDAAVARAQADTLDQEVVLEVWTSYYAFKTATQLVRTSRDLLASAEQSERVALGRYKEGVGTILDLLTAQAALASARAQEIQARAGWFVAMAQLAHDTGTIPPLNQTVTIVKEGSTP